MEINETVDATQSTIGNKTNCIFQKKIDIVVQNRQICLHKYCHNHVKSYGFWFWT